MPEVTCVDENVAFWEMRLRVVGVVCVGYAKEANGEYVGSVEATEGEA